MLLLNINIFFNFFFFFNDCWGGQLYGRHVPPVPPGISAYVLNYQLRLHWAGVTLRFYLFMLNCPLPLIVKWDKENGASFGILKEIFLSSFRISWGGAAMDTKKNDSMLARTCLTFQIVYVRLCSYNSPDLLLPGWEDMTLLHFSLSVRDGAATTQPLTKSQNFPKIIKWIGNSSIVAWYVGYVFFR